MFVLIYVCTQLYIYINSAKNTLNILKLKEVKTFLLFSNPPQNKICFFFFFVPNKN